MKLKVIPIIFLVLCFMLVFTSIQIPVSYASPGYEDFTDGTWIEVEPDDRIQKTAHHCDIDAYANEDAYLYSDKGLCHFSNFTHLVDFKTVNPPPGCHVVVWELSNDLDDYYGLLTGSKTTICLRWYHTSYLYLCEAYGGSQYYDFNAWLSGDTWYYLKIVKSEKSFTCKIYGSTSDRANDENVIDTLALTLYADYNFRYVFACNTLDIDLDVHVNADIENLVLQEDYVTFYFNEGGQFRVDNTIITNGTQNNYMTGTVIELVAVPENSSYIFQSFNWTGGSATTNPHNYTITENMTIWCYFGVCEGDGLPYIVARFTFSPSNPKVDETITFNGSKSESSETITSYSWNFGDGNTSNIAEPIHSFSTAQTFNVELTVTSDAGSDSFIQQITVETESTTPAPSEEQGALSGNYVLTVHTTYNNIPCTAKVHITDTQNLSQTKESDLLGKTHFNLPLGNYKISVTYEDDRKEKEISLTKDIELSFKFTGKQKFPTKIGLLIIVIIVALGLLWMYPDLMPKKYREKIRRHKSTVKRRKHKSTVKPRKHKRR